MTGQVRTVWWWRTTATEWAKLTHEERVKWWKWTGEIPENSRAIEFNELSPDPAGWYSARAWDFRQGDVRGANLG